jgi:hypothetical protein
VLAASRAPSPRPVAVVVVYRTEEMLCEPFSGADPFLPTTVGVVGWIPIIHGTTIL